MTPERVVVSGVGSGLLDPVTGSWDGARHALAVLARLRVPLVLCSTRPRAELAVLSRLFGLDAPMIVENGAARDSALGRLAHSASRYEYSEPFLLESAQDEAAFAAKAERRGLRLVRGPRYLHLCDGGDKGLAVRTLLSLYERSGPPPKAIGVGAWPPECRPGPWRRHGEARRMNE